MNNLFSAFFSKPTNQTPTEFLLEDLLTKNINYEWLTDPIDGDKTIAVFTQSRQVSVHFFMREFVVLYCFYDRTIKKCTIEYEHLTIEDTMNNFDEFILHHYNNAKDNPYLCQKYLK